jgi:hypothetical protein
MKKFIIALAFCFAHHAWGDSQLSTRVVYSSTNVGTVTWVQLVASMPYASNSLNIFDSSGQTMQLGVGQPGFEQQLIIIPPGGTEVKVGISGGQRVVIRAISGTANGGESDINYEY